MELSDYRQQIDGIDSQLLALFYQRMEVAAQIAGLSTAGIVRWPRSLAQLASC